jgi:hypothetical protein
VTFAVVVELDIDGVWTDITSHVYIRDPIQITRGRTSEAGQIDPSDCTMTVNNRDGRYSPRNPTSPYFGIIGRNTQIRVSVAGDIRFVGEVTAWPVKWDKAGVDVFVPLEAAGVLRRLGQGNPVEASPLRSTLLASDPLVYWPLDDGLGSKWGVNLGSSRTATVFRRFPFLPGTAQLAFGDGDLGDNLPPGMRLITTAGTGNWISGRVGDRVSITGYAVDFIYKAETLGEFRLIVIDLVGSLDSQEWEIKLRGDGVNDDIEVLYAFDGGAPTTQGNTAALTAITDGDLHHVRFTATEDGSTVDWEVFVDGASVLTGTRASTSVGSFYEIRMEYVPGSGTDMAVGHLAVWRSTDAAPAVADVADATHAYAGEAAGRRIERLCGENDVNVSFINVGNLDETTAMGPQRAGDRVALMQEAAAADGGFLYEPRDNLALTYRTRISLYNRDPALVLAYTDKVFAAAPEPVGDDQHTRNDITLSRPSGGSVNKVLTSGPLSTDDVGRYEQSETVNLVDDGFLDNQANWRLALGTVNEARFPQLAVGLHMPAFSFSSAANLATPGTFEATLESWAAGGSVPPTVTRDSTRAHSGTWSMKIAWGTGGLFPQSAKTISGLTVGARYKVTGWAWVTPGSPSVRFVIATISPAGPSTVTHGAWERFTFKFTATLTSHSLQVWPVRDPVSGETAWVDDITFQATAISDDVTGVDIGDRVLVEDLPLWLPPDDVHQMAVGFTEELTNFTWDVAINGVPASPYEIAVYGSTVGADPSKYDTAGSQLASGINTTATSLSVTTTIGPVWTDVNAEDGFDIYIGGERMTVTDISGTTSPQTFTVIRSVNQVVKSHAAGAAVRLWRTPRYGL